tara:strand:+ start:1804 stop:2088 length:285 start_codon:yes stop_codon:yes gene_type:complete
MTKQDFLEGKPFSLKGDFSNTTTYKYRAIDSDLGCIEREYRYTKNVNTILLSDNIMNVEKIGTKKVHLFTFLFRDKITKKISYKDMIEFEIVEE